MQSRPLDKIRRPDGTPQSLLLEFGGMAPQFVQYGHLNLPQDCMDILKEYKQPSTRSAYAFKWKPYYMPGECYTSIFTPLGKIWFAVILHQGALGGSYCLQKMSFTNLFFQNLCD